MTTNNRLALPKINMPKVPKPRTPQNTFPGMNAGKLRSLSAMSRAFKPRPKSAY
jgi:hypothetical protein